MSVVEKTPIIIYELLLSSVFLSFHVQKEKKISVSPKYLLKEPRFFYDFVTVFGSMFISFDIFDHILVMF